tara:strand:+ start:1581 stop:1853 length:273 start_codon:yes stop_codon:yes gene_type:complete
MFGLVSDGVSNLTSRGRDAEQKQDLGHPANVQLINRGGTAAFIVEPALVQEVTKAMQPLQKQTPSTIAIPKTCLPRKRTADGCLKAIGSS